MSNFAFCVSRLVVFLFSQFGKSGMMTVFYILWRECEVRRGGREEKNDYLVRWFPDGGVVHWSLVTGQLWSV